MHRFNRVQQCCFGTGTVEGGHHFLTNMKVFANTGHNDFSAVFHRFENPFNRRAEMSVDLIAHLFHACDFNIHDLFGSFLKVHFVSCFSKVWKILIKTGVAGSKGWKTLQASARFIKNIGCVI